MRRTSAEIKRLAREILTHRYGIPMGAMVVTQLIMTVLLLPFSWNITAESSVREWTIYYIASFVISLLGVILSVGSIRIALCMARRQEYRLKDLFYGFFHHPDRYILAALLLMVLALIPAIPFAAAAVCYVVLDGGIGAALLLVAAALLMLVGEIFLALRYALNLYLLLDHPEMGVLEAFRVSKEKMKGSKGRLLYIGLSFIGWGALGVMSFGIGYLWIGPYITQTQTCFYLEVTGEAPVTEPGAVKMGAARENRE